ncbi:LuxR C-terminal-related transcriptional regulator [Streptomyces sp. NPDC001407]|uniref:LuxR C-terminal-related transcriptional regulator n=1 Tax=unclassified Streptomyces TaxID=2593676 RepID=UPI0036C1AAB0
MSAPVLADPAPAAPDGPSADVRPFDHLGVATACLDPALTIRQANQEFFRKFGDSSAGICGLGFCDTVVHPSVRQPLMRRFARLVEGRHEDRFRTEVIAMGPEGAAFTTPLTAVSVRGGTPDATTILVLMPTAPGTDDTHVVAGRKPLLSEVDARIIEGIAAGVATVPLAARLHLSRQGVEYHVTCLLRKLRVPNRAALVSRAYSLGVLKVGTWPPKVVEDFVG